MVRSGLGERQACASPGERSAVCVRNACSLALPSSCFVFCSHSWAWENRCLMLNGRIFRKFRAQKSSIVHRLRMSRSNGLCGTLGEDIFLRRHLTRRNQPVPRGKMPRGFPVGLPGEPPAPIIRLGFLLPSLPGMIATDATIGLTDHTGTCGDRAAPAVSRSL